MNLNFENKDPKFTNNWPDTSELNKYLSPAIEGKGYRKFSVPLTEANVLAMNFPEDVVYINIVKLQKDLLPLKTFEFKIEGALYSSLKFDRDYIAGLYLVAETISLDASKVIRDFLDLKDLGFGYIGTASPNRFSTLL